MSANPDYPQSWLPQDFDCACGIKTRVDYENVSGPYSAQQFQHSCGKDVVHDIPGRIIAKWEQKDGKWVRI